MACHTPPLKKVKKQGEIQLPSLGPIPLKNVEFRCAACRSGVAAVVRWVLLECGGPNLIESHIQAAKPAYIQTQDRKYRIQGKPTWLHWHR